MAENSNLPIGIIVNKIELSSNKSKTENDFLNYQSLGYDVHFLSVKKQINLDFFKEQLVNKSHIFLGQSGVGKSSLINSLIPDLQLRVNEISSKSKLGKHTTTNTTIYHIPSGGDLIDYPGVREFQLDSLTELEIKSGFKEFRAFSCKYRECSHDDEPDCGIKKALEQGLISESRYRSFIGILKNRSFREGEFDDEDHEMIADLNARKQNQESSDNME